MPGDFSVMNTLQAATCGYLDGISQRIIRQAIKNLSRVKGRLERVHLPTNEFSVYIDFAHTPDALIKLLSTVRSFMTREQRLVLVFGCGGDRDKHKRPIMGGIASSYADFVIITSDNSRSERTEDIISDILSGFDYECPHTVIEDRAAAIGFAVSHALTNDVIVLAGKGHEQYQILSDGTHPFDESAIVLSSIKDNMKNRGQF
jgi:UDP-N-acetylmuramoyl-L-alanyl-D-glutamate--2,6-diaminopimelate ligase